MTIEAVTIKDMKFCEVLDTYGRRSRKQCACDFCSQLRILRKYNKVTPELMRQITDKTVFGLLIRAICLGQYPVKLP